MIKYLCFHSIKQDGPYIALNHSVSRFKRETSTGKIDSLFQAVDPICHLLLYPEFAGMNLFHGEVVNIQGSKGFLLMIINFVFNVLILKPLSLPTVFILFENR